MAGSISNSTVHVHAGASMEQVQMVSDLQALMGQQLEVLAGAYKTLEPAKGDIIGIQLDGANDAKVEHCHIEGADLAINVLNTNRSVLSGLNIQGVH